MNASSRNFVIVTMLVCMGSLPSVGAELRPYSLPSQQTAPRIEQRQIEQRAVRPRISESYYWDFEKKAKGLKPAQHADLTRFFERKLEQAKESGRFDEEDHYRRLLQILRSTQ